MEGKPWFLYAKNKGNSMLPSSLVGYQLLLNQNVLLTCLTVFQSNAKNFLVYIMDILLIYLFSCSIKRTKYPQMKKSRKTLLLF